MLFFVVNALVLIEFFKILKIGVGKTLKFKPAVITGSLLYLVFSLVFMLLIDRQYIILTLLAPVILLVFELFRKSIQPVSTIALLQFGLIYISIPFALLNLIFARSDFFTGNFPWILTGLFVVIWVNDTFAYLIGILMGKHKLFERISPKKTWEGTLGGLFFSLIAGFLFHYFSNTLNLWQWIALSGLIAVAGDLGDLIESMMKRSFNIKDSGNFLPGHGGLLDRFDSLLIASPVAAIFLTLI